MSRTSWEVDQSGGKVIKPAREPTAQTAESGIALGGAWVEQVARLGRLLAGQVELDALLERAVELFGELVAADTTAVVTVEGNRAQLRAHRGLSGKALRGWPRPLSTIEQWQLGWPEAGRDAAESSPMCPVSAEAQLNARPSPSPGPATATIAPNSPTTLQVPVYRDGTLIALLFASRGWHRPFPAGSARLAAIFADYLSVAMVNAELYRTLQQRATHDPLTGLANRILVSQHLDQVLAEGRPGPVGLLFCDLDRFKAVNDLLGHEAGDELLQQVAGELRRCVRPDDLLARFGGDEFLIVLSGVRNLAEVAEVGARVARALDREYTLGGRQRVRVSASIGGVLGVPGRSNASLMLRHADAALYAAKDRGLGQVEVFDEAASYRSLHRLDLRAEVGHAIECDQLRVYYQPVARVEDDHVVAFEAKLHWHHPRHGRVPADVLVPLAEDTGWIEAIGTWLLERACRQLAVWQAQPGGRQLAISVDISADQLNRPGAVNRLLRVIEAAGVAPASVWLEISPHHFRSDELLAQASQLHEAGVRFVLDGFGTAYSNLRFLRWFPFGVLKIDLASVSEVACWVQDPSLVKAILAIADSLHLTAIGDGVRPGHEYATLRELGCELAQGQLPEVTAEQATELLRSAAHREPPAGPAADPRRRQSSRPSRWPRPVAGARAPGQETLPAPTRALRSAIRAGETATE